MKELDSLEHLILRELIRDPRLSDNGVAVRTGLNPRTVSRRRERLEQEGIVSYHAHLDLTATGTGQNPARHLYTIKFRVGVTLRQVTEDIAREPFVRSLFTEAIFESHIAEMDGKVALLLFIDGTSDVDIVQTVQEKLIPSLMRNHGENSIEEISTMRVLAPVRIMRNYLPAMNMAGGKIREDWPNEAIFVGKILPGTSNEPSSKGEAAPSETAGVVSEPEPQAASEPAPAPETATEPQGDFNEPAKRGFWEKLSFTQKSNSP